MKQLICSIVAVGASAAWADVKPTACWDGDFSEKTKAGITLSVGSGNVESGNHTSIALGATVGVGLDWASGISAFTLMVKYSNLRFPTSGYRSFANAKTVDRSSNVKYDGSSPGVCCNSTGKTTGEWFLPSSTKVWTASGVTEGVYPLDDGSGVFAFVYDPGGQVLKGVTLLKRTDDAWQVVYRATGLLTGDDVGRIRGVSVGGPNADLSANSLAAFEGMTVESVAFFNAPLTADDLATYCFPSEADVYNASVSQDGSPYAWSRLVWSKGSAPALVTDIATITVSGDAVLEMDETPLEVAELTVLGSGSLKLTGVGRLGAVKLTTEVPVILETAQGDVTIGAGVSFLQGGSLGNGSLATKAQGVVNGAVSGTGALHVSEGRVLFLGALNQAGGTQVDAGATAAVETGTFGSGAVVGSGVACFRKVLPDDATRASFLDAAHWTGTCRLELLNAGILNLDPNIWGTASSKVCFAGVPATTYFPGKWLDINPEVILEDVTENGVTTYGLNIDNGYTDMTACFRKLSGTGTFNCYYGTTPSHIVRIKDGSDFHGSIRVRKSRFCFSDSGALPPCTTTASDCGFIVVPADVSLEVAKGSAWYSSNATCGIYLYGHMRCCTGEAFAFDRTAAVAKQVCAKVQVFEGATLEMYMTAAENQGSADELENTRERSRDYTWLAGEGTVLLTDDGDHETYRALPQANKMWASTLSISNAQEAGLLLLADSAATTANPSVYELKNLSGAGGFNSNQPPFGENRLVRVTQSVSTVWGGTFDARTRQDNVVGLSVAGADGVDSKTLVLTGHNSCTNALTVEASGSVRLEGTWVGDVSVSGEFGGNGRQTDGLVTFAGGASLSVDVGAGGLHLAGMDSWPSSIVVSGFADPASVRRVALLTSDRPLPPGFENVALTVDEGLQGDWRVVKEERALCLRRNIGLMLLLR